ncbi:MAG TPA: hypothetical protein VF681_06360 [Abditibacteriaceae bacterium]|jgi:hypothetical protein
MISPLRYSMLAFATCIAPVIFTTAHSAEKPSAQAVPYQASRVAGVRVRSVPMRSATAGAASVYRRPGTVAPRGLANGRNRNPAKIRPLRGGGVVAKVDRSWHAESRAVVVNGRVYTVCNNAAHGGQTHYHDAKGTARSVR